jgi:hypothetical protein
MRLAVIDGSTVVNIIEASAGFKLSGLTVVPAGNAGIGFEYDGSNLSPPSVSFDDLKRQKSDAVSSKRNAVLSGGFTVPAEVSTALGGRVLQTRNDADRTTWLTSQAAYQAAVSGGQGSTEGAKFRPLDNITTTLSYSEGLNVLLAMAAWGKSVYGRSWELKDAIASAADNAAIDAIDIESGWPE